MSFTPRIHENGGPCCYATNDAGERIPTISQCEKCNKHFVAKTLRESVHTNQEDRMENYTPQDPYADGLKKLRAASATSASRFEDEYKAARLREFEAEYARLATLRAAHAARLAATPHADLESYAPPDPYRAGLDKMRSEKR